MRFLPFKYGNVRIGDVMMNSLKEGIHMKKEMDSQRLGTAPLGKLMVSLAVPAVAAQLINVLYNIVDRIYIGHISGYGDVALTGVGVTFPIIMLISAFSAFAGMGGAPLASIELGRQDYRKAELILGNSAGMIALFSVALTIGFTIFKRPVLYAFGASDVTIAYAESYIGIYLVGTIFVQIAIGLNTFISGQGESQTAMLSVVIGAVLNIILDPVLIFLLGLGVRGAAIATVISQAVSAAWVIHFLTRGRSVIKLKLQNMRLKSEIVKRIAGLGISPFIMQSTESMVSITLNSGLQVYGGDLYVGTMSIMTSIMQLILIPVQGIAQGVQPVISYSYGAGNRERVKGAFMRLVVSGLLGTLILGGIAVLAPEVYAGIFTNNEKLIELTCQVMPVYFLGITIFGLQSACQSTFLALGQAKVSLFIALLRKVFLLIPLAVIFPRFMGVMGVYRAEPVADIISVVTTGIVFTFTMKKVLRSMDENKTSKEA